MNGHLTATHRAADGSHTHVQILDGSDDLLLVRPLTDGAAAFFVPRAQVADLA
jgi:hypothetical protein